MTARPARHPFLDHEGILAFAHRGGDRHAPENTFAAFEHAVSLGYRYLETDVHASKDGVLFAFHDDDLARLIGRDVQFDALLADDIAALRIGGAHVIPKMADLLEAFPQARFNIDAKHWNAVSPLCEVIEKAGAHERICIGSFDDGRVEAIVARLGDVCHSVGVDGGRRFRLGSFVSLPQTFSAGCIQLPPAYKAIQLITPATCAYAHRLGMQLHAWTINAADEINRLLDIGVDGIMTDDCALLKEILVARGLWNASPQQSVASA